MSALLTLVFRLATDRNSRPAVRDGRCRATAPFSANLTPSHTAFREPLPPRARPHADTT
jgi:hypothetical protein